MKSKDGRGNNQLEPNQSQDENPIQCNEHRQHRRYPPDPRLLLLLLLLLSLGLIPLHHSLMHSGSTCDHALNIFHTVCLERAHQLLLLRLGQAVIPRVAVEFPELLHVLVGHGLGFEGSLRWVRAAGLEEGGGGSCWGADVGWEGLLVLILLRGIEILLLLMLLLVRTGGVSVLGPVVVVDEVGEVVPLVG